MNRFILIAVAFSCCGTPVKQKVVPAPLLNMAEAEKLAALPMKCIQLEYPNKLNQTLRDSSYLASPRTLHPAFYGCFDWHSSVHGHWMLVRLLKEFPEFRGASEARLKLRQNLTKEKIEGELIYFNRAEEQSFERTYGWAWLLKLSEELQTWNHPLGRELAVALQPLTELIVDRYMEFLPKLTYPIRVGEHTNTAFGLTFAWDYAVSTENQSLQDIISQRARDFYLQDQQCPVSWEPGGYDFLSPCLEEIDIMRRILSTDEFPVWLNGFMPQLREKSFTMEPAVVSDRTDGKLVHLDGVNFSRAWCLYGLARDYPEYVHLVNTANEHMNYSLPQVVDGGYEGEHWLASFALNALFEGQFQQLKD